MKTRSDAVDERHMKKRMIVYVDETMFVPGHGYRVSIVTEGEAGHCPTGNWPYTGMECEKMPWFWGPTISDARRACREHNERMGVTPEDEFKILMSSMRAR